MPVNKKLLIGFISLLCIVAIIWGIVSHSSNGLKSIVDEQLAAIRAGDMPKAYSYTSSDFRSVTTLTDFQDFVEHYPALKDNKKSKFDERDVSEGVGVLSGTVTSESGEVLPIQYTLVKEDKVWRIVNIQVNPIGYDLTSDQTSSDSSAMSMYDNKDSHYMISYPGNWEYEKAGDGTVIFSGKRGTEAYFSTVNIQTVLAKKAGGDYDSVKQFMADIKRQAKAQSPSVRFLESGPITVVEKGGDKDVGEYTIFSYKYKGREFKQWQVVVMRHDGQVFYAWAYTSPIAQYPKDLEVAKNMLQSWVIY